jgi:hypothetical protein
MHPVHPSIFPAYMMQIYRQFGSLQTIQQGNNIDGYRCIEVLVWRGILSVVKLHIRSANKELRMHIRYLMNNKAICWYKDLRMQKSLQIYTMHEPTLLINCKSYVHSKRDNS